MIRRCTDSDVPVIESIINQAAQAYEGVIPSDCFHHPYMTEHELLKEIAAGVQFWASEEEGTVIGVMGVQNLRDVTLIRHAYVANAHQKRGIGGALLNALVQQAKEQLLWAHGLRRSGRSASMSGMVSVWFRRRRRTGCSALTGRSLKGNGRPPSY